MTDWWGWGKEEKRRQAAALQEIRHSYLTGIVKELREINSDFALPSKGPEVEVAGFSRKAKRFEKAATRKDQILPPAGMNSECGNQTLGPKDGLVTECRAYAHKPRSSSSSRLHGCSDFEWACRRARNTSLQDRVE